MTSLEGLITAEHLKSVMNMPLCPRKRTQSLPPSENPAKRRKVDLKPDLAPVKKEAEDEKETKSKVPDVTRKRTQSSPPSESLAKRRKVDLKLNLAPVKEEEKMEVEDEKDTKPPSPVLSDNNNNNDDRKDEDEEFSQMY